MSSPDHTLTGRVALVTGVSRRSGIAAAVVRRLLDAGADVFCTHHRPHDVEQPWGADDLAELYAGLRAVAPGRRVVEHGADLADPDAPAAVMAAALEAFGHVDVLVCVHARSGGDGPLATMTAERLDTHYVVNTRSTLLLTREFAAQHDDARPGRVVWFTSGQNLGPMSDEIAYAASKAALAGIAPSVAADLVERNITVNVVNPGPVDTGYLAGVTPGAAMPLGRWGRPEDPARLVSFLVSDDADWITGQVVNSEGGFRRGVPFGG